MEANLEDIQFELQNTFHNFERLITRLFKEVAIPIIEANPPTNPGVYVFYDENQVLSYIGDDVTPS